MSSWLLWGGNPALPRAAGLSGTWEGQKIGVLSSPPSTLTPSVPFTSAARICLWAPEPPVLGKAGPSHPGHTVSPPRDATAHHHPKPRSVLGWDPGPGAPSPADITHPTPAPGPSAHAVPSAASALTPGPADVAADAAASSVAKGGA